MVPNLVHLRNSICWFFRCNKNSTVLTGVFYKTLGFQSPTVLGGIWTTKKHCDQTPCAGRYLEDCLSGRDTVIFHTQVRVYQGSGLIACNCMCLLILVAAKIFHITLATKCRLWSWRQRSPQWLPDKIQVSGRHAALSKWGSPQNSALRFSAKFDEKVRWPTGPLRRSGPQWTCCPRTLVPGMQRSLTCGVGCDIPSNG